MDICTDAQGRARGYHWIKDKNTQSGETIFIVTIDAVPQRFTMSEVLDFVQHQLKDQNLADRLWGR